MSRDRVENGCGIPYDMRSNPKIKINKYGWLRRLYEPFELARSRVPQGKNTKSGIPSPDYKKDQSYAAIKKMDIPKRPRIQTEPTDNFNWVQLLIFLPPVQWVILVRRRNRCVIIDDHWVIVVLILIIARALPFVASSTTRSITRSAFVRVDRVTDIL